MNSTGFHVDEERLPNAGAEGCGLRGFDTRRAKGIEANLQVLYEVGAKGRCTRKHPQTRHLDQLLQNRCEDALQTRRRIGASTYSICAQKWQQEMRVDIIASA